MEEQELAERLKNAAARLQERKEIAAVYLFGSCATGRRKPGSDIDLAVLLDGGAKKSFLEERLELMAEMSSMLGTDNIDLIILNGAPAGLAFRVVSEGRLLYLKDGARPLLVQFKARVFDRYFDYQPVRELFSSALSRRIREGRFGGR